MRDLIAGSASSFASTFLSELGDKTFMLIVLYATQMSSLKLMLLATFTLCGMHFGAVAVGTISQKIISRVIVYWVTICSFIITGLILIYLAFTGEQDDKVILFKPFIIFRLLNLKRSLGKLR